MSVPNKDGYPESFSVADWGLVEVPHIETYHGLIFGTWNPEPMSLREALGDMAWYMDAMLDHDDEGTEVIGGVHKWVLEGNWKLSAEQFATDWYHVNMSHASALTIMSRQERSPRTRSSTGAAASTWTPTVTAPGSRSTRRTGSMLAPCTTTSTTTHCANGSGRPASRDR